VRRAFKWIAFAVAGVAAALGLAALNRLDTGDPNYAFRSVWVWVLGVIWVVLMISAIFVEKRRG
jgi:hypothetical protein